MMSRLFACVAALLLASAASANTTGSLVVLLEPFSSQQLAADPNIEVDTTSNTIKICGVTIGGGTSSGGSTFVSPLTTKGDLYTYTSADARLPVGTMGQSLTPNDNATQGIEWTTVYPQMARKIAMLNVLAASASTGSFSTFGTPTWTATAASGTTGFANSAGSAYAFANTQAASNAIGSIATSVFMRCDWDPDFTFFMNTDSIGSNLNIREYVGLEGSTSDLTTSDVPTLAFLGFRYSTTASNNHWWGIITNGTTASTVDTGISAAGTNSFKLRCTYDSTGNVARFYINGAYRGSISAATGTPGSSLCRAVIVSRTLAAATKNVFLYSFAATHN
jgi:hypothetical protein